MICTTVRDWVVELFFKLRACKGDWGGGRRRGEKAGERRRGEGGERGQVFLCWFLVTKLNFIRMCPCLTFARALKTRDLKDGVKTIVTASAILLQCYSCTSCVQREAQKKVTCSRKVSDKEGFHERIWLGQTPCVDNVVLASHCKAVDTHTKKCNESLLQT